MNKEFLHMQKLAGLITENEYKQKLIKELQYFHNGVDSNQIINYDDSDIMDDLEALGQGSMDGQDFKAGETYNIGGQDYKIQAQGDEFKLVLAEMLKEGITIPTKENSGWSLKDKLEDVHTKPGQGSIFAKSIDSVLKLAQDTLDKTKDIDKIANNTGTLIVKSPGIGYNLVLPIEQAKKLPGAKETEVEKIEGPNKIKVPAITTTAPLTQFKSDELTIIVRPKKDEAGAIIPNEYIVLSAFPGDPSIPKASEWGKKYAVIIPGGKEELKEVDKSSIKVESDIDEIINEVLIKYRKSLKENLTKDEFEQIIDKNYDFLWDDMFYGSGPDNEDEENQLINATASRTQEELEKKYSGIEVKVQPTNKGNNFYTVENEEKNIPYFEYTKS